jgi:hypothetical protein
VGLEVLTGKPLLKLGLPFSLLWAVLLGDLGCYEGAVGLVGLLVAIAVPPVRDDNGVHSLATVSRRNNHNSLISTTHSCFIIVSSSQKH